MSGLQTTRGVVIRAVLASSCDTQGLSAAGRVAHTLPTESRPACEPGDRARGAAQGLRVLRRETEKGEPACTSADHPAQGTPTQP